MSRFRAIYIAAIAVVLFGLVGSAFVPKAHAAPARPKAPALTILTDHMNLSTDLPRLAGFAGTGCLSLAGLMSLASSRK